MKKSKATEALRVATDVAAIRAALYQRGYQLRKQPKQPVWKVIITPDHFYKLTYQPASVSAWVLHPQNNDTRAMPYSFGQPFSGKLKDIEKKEFYACLSFMNND